MIEPTEIGRSVSRRGLLKGSLAAACLCGLAACASNIQKPGAGPASEAAKQAGGEGPFGYVAASAGTIAIPVGGWGETYLQKMIEDFKTLHEGAQISYEVVEDPKVKMQPRVAQKDLPDLWDAKGMNSRELAANGHLASLSDVLNAEALDGGKVSDYLRPDWEKGARVGDSEPLNFPISMSLRGFWYSGKLFDENGWTVPKTWPELLELCAKIKAKGIAPFTYAGTIDYTVWPTMEVIIKTGGKDAIERIEGLDTSFWDEDLVVRAAEAILELRKRDYILAGSEGINHTESQSYWAKGEAALIPVGGWVENESADVLPDDFEARMMPVPALDDKALYPPETVSGSINSSWCLPTAAKNPAFGKEFARYMLSKRAARIWYQETKSLAATDPTWVADLATSSGQKSQIDLLQAAGEHFYDLRIAPGVQEWRMPTVDLCNRLWGGQIAGKEFAAGLKKAAEAARRVLGS